MSRVFPVPTSHPALFADSDRGPFSMSINTLEVQRNKFKDAANRKDTEMYSVEHFDTPYKSILSGVQELGPMSRAFFSSQNMSWLQTHIRYEVYKRTDKKHVISNQDETNLLIVMRAIYLERSNNPLTQDEQKKEILRLNLLVIEEVVPDIITELNQYTDYLRDISRNGIPLARPINTSVAGTKLYEGFAQGFADVLGL